jgi:aminoglycoside phosphotransferase (APT) family kinase protein
MRKIGEGDKSDVFLRDDGSVLKLFVPHYADLAPIEHDIADMLGRAGVLAPPVTEAIEVDGRPGLVFGTLEAGHTLSREVRARPWRVGAAARQLAELHAAVNECHSSELPSQRERLVDEIDSAHGVPKEVKHAALTTLEALPDGDAVCHNDIHMLNVIVHPSGSTIIDWVLATRGNPIGDLAGAVLQLRFGEQPRGIVARAALETGRAVFWRAYLRRYRQLRPFDRDQLTRWELPVAVALAGRRAGRMREQLLGRISQLIGSPETALTEKEVRS